MNSRKGILFVLSGPSGAGKGTVLKQVFARMTGIAYSISCTTRAPRVGELDGINYYFLSNSKFEEMIKNNEFLEHVRKFNNYYGTPKHRVMELLDQGSDVLLEIETLGAEKIHEDYPDACFIFITPSSISEIANRLRMRATEDEKVQAMRISIGKNELKSIYFYDYIAINDDLDACVESVYSIITAERTKISRNPNFINKLLQSNHEKN